MSNAEILSTDDRSPRKPARKVSRTDAGNLRLGAPKTSDLESNLMIQTPPDRVPILSCSSAYPASAAARFALQPLLQTVTLTGKFRLNMRDAEQLDGHSV